MLEIISKGFSKAKSLLRKETTLTENNIREALKEVRLSLLDADVEYSVVRLFIDRVSERALGLTVKTSVTDKKGQRHKLSPAEHFVGICYEELTSLMGPKAGPLTFTGPKATFMMVGLQGSGKTTSTAKLANLLVTEYKRKPLLVAADIYRPGAAHQLEVLGERLNLPVFHIEGASAQVICQKGLEKATELHCDAVIFDTAGRLAIDEQLMDELVDIKRLVAPEHIYLVVDAMIGQDAVKTASQFDERLDLSGVILTKLDGDARGGAAISIKEVTKKPIVFLGMGEDLASLEPFRPEGLASRILGMGDMVSLAKDFEKHVDEQEAEEDMKRLMKGSFSFDDFLKQLNMIKKIGTFQSIIERIPGFSEILPEGQKIDDREFMKLESMVLSMTRKERAMPELLVKQKSRRSRIAGGSGRSFADVDGLIQRFMTMRQMMAFLGKNPNAISSSPMFKNMTSASKIAQNFSGKNPMAELMSGMKGPFGDMMPGMERMPIGARIESKGKKSQRKQQKLARKKNKKRK